MKLKVKTQDDRLFQLDVTPGTQIREVKADVHERDATLDANAYRILFQVLTLYELRTIGHTSAHIGSFSRR